ncbi:LppU/SCO3897 family protein [Streptomyces sp. NBC_01478]|uniref:LppU/SCO3897 family protein n=1 Tax=Streptomyces sp. NBC_01478 TaxID=2903882 RepID=UPI003FCE8436
MIRLVVIIVIAAGAAIFSYISSQDDADTAKVGDCMHRGSTSDTNPDLEVVKCSDSKAEYVVLAKISGTYSETAADAKCTAAAKDFQYSYTESGDGSNFLLCLKDYSK